MKLKQTLIAAAIAVAPMTAMAGGSLDAFYVDNEIEIGESADGDGFGFRGQAELGQGFGVSGLYQNTEVTTSGESLDILETRLGVTYTHRLNKTISVGANLETVQLDLKQDDATALGLDGYSLGLRGDVNVINNLSVYAKVAYTDLGDIDGEDLDGVEYEGGAHYSFNKNLGAFVEYRVIDLEIDGEDLTLDTIRAGGRFTF